MPRVRTARGYDCRGGLPEDMTAEALMEAMNLLYGYEEYKSLVEALGLNL